MWLQLFVLVVAARLKPAGGTDRIGPMLPKTVIVALVALGSSGCGVEAVAPVEGLFDRTLAVNGPVDLDIRTGAGGGIRMSVLADPGFEVDASTGSGGIHIE